MKTCCQNLTMIKICGLTRQEDADVCGWLETSLAGFIFHPASPRAVTPEQAAAIRTGTAMRVGVFVRQSVDEILRIMEQARLHLAQLHGDQGPAFCAALGKSKVMRVFWPERYDSLRDLEADLQRYAPCCRFFLFDAGKQLGGHGAEQDWTRLKGLRSPKSWFIAGGLGPDNVLAAIDACNPCGVDLNSGVESAPGIKDHDKLKAVLRQLCSPQQA